MANELTIGANLAYLDSNDVAAELFIAGLRQDVTTKVFYRGTQSIGTTPTTIGRGNVSSLGYLFLKNLDATNFVTVYDDNSDAVAVLKPGGGVCLLYAGADMQTPLAVADTAACLIDALLISR